jgi:hypothetical protein
LISAGCSTWRSGTALRRRTRLGLRHDNRERTPRRERACRGRRVGGARDRRADEGCVECQAGAGGEAWAAASARCCSAGADSDHASVGYDLAGDRRPHESFRRPRRAWRAVVRDVNQPRARHHSSALIADRADFTIFWSGPRPTVVGVLADVNCSGLELSPLMSVNFPAAMLLGLHAAATRARPVGAARAE